MYQRLSFIALTTIALVCLAALPLHHASAQQKPRTVLVHDVTSVDLTFEKSNPPNALVKAKGRVMTGGYTKPRLSLVIYVQPPADGIQDLRFEIDAPNGVVPQVITEVETPVLKIQSIPKWFKGVRVIAETNKIEKVGP